MNDTARQQRGYVTSSRLILLAFVTVFVPRALASVGAPSVVNFAHFLVVPCVFGIAIFNARSKDQQQISISWKILAGLFTLFTIVLASTLINNAGFPNLFLSFLLLAEPFMMLLAIVVTPLSPAHLAMIRKYFCRLCSAHIGLALFQYHVLKMHTLQGQGLIGGDHIQGIFWKSGAGHVVGASVSLSFGLYYFASAKKAPTWLRFSLPLAALWQLLIADAKQVLLSFMVAGVLLLITKSTKIIRLIQYLIVFAVLGLVFLWCLQNVPAFAAFNVWIRPEIYGPEGEATLLKTSVFRIVPTFYQSPLNLLLGLGPGHTVGRLGGWMLAEYEDLLNPLGATRHEASRAVWRTIGESWLGDQSSMFSPMFGWAGIWGDLGLLGLGVYLYLAFVIWRYLCVDDISKLLLLSIGVIGLIFSQMEEPGYMLSLAMMIGLRWQDKKTNSTNIAIKYSRDFRLG